MWQPIASFSSFNFYTLCIILLKSFKNEGESEYKLIQSKEEEGKKEKSGPKSASKKEKNKREIEGKENDAKE